MVRPVFKTALGVALRGPVGSIPTRSRHPPPAAALRPGPGARYTSAMRRPAATRCRAALLAAGVALAVAASLRAQDTTAVAPDTAAAVRDTLRAPSIPVSRGEPPVSPGGAFLRSALLPGWGQFTLRRPVVGAIFVGTEALTLGMSIYKDQQRRDALAQGDSVAAATATRQREDWLILLAVNHLAAGIEAFVAANLWDFPGQLTVRRAPGGRTEALLTLPFRAP